MKVTTVLITASLISAFASSAPIALAEESAPVNEAPSSGAPACSGECGYAVISDDGVVHGVIVCQEGCFGGVMPVDYMGCPAGCSLVLQSPADETGNVAGVHGPDVIYTPENNTFSRVDSETGASWELIGGQPLNEAVIVLPPTPEPEEPVLEPTPDTTQPPETTASMPQEPISEPAPSTEAPQEPDVEMPQEPDFSSDELLNEIIDFMTNNSPDTWPTEVSPEVEVLINDFYDLLRDIVLNAWPDYF